MRGSPIDELPVAPGDWFERHEVGGGVTRITEPHVDPFLRCNCWYVPGRDAKRGGHHQPDQGASPFSPRLRHTRVLGARGGLNRRCRSTSCR